VRLRCLYFGAKFGEIEWQRDHFRAQGNTPGAEKLRNPFFRLMWDLSEFMKTLKRRFTCWYNRQHERKGTLFADAPPGRD
jgi:hypothetical protein